MTLFRLIAVLWLRSFLNCIFKCVVPVSISSNVTGLAIAEESSLKTLPGTPIWYALEPNTYAEMGAKFTTVSREIINATRQRLFGTIVDESAKAGMNIDLTQRNMTRFLQGFMFADAFEKPATQPFNGTQVTITSVSATQYLAAAGLNVFLVNHLVSAKNFSNSGNNGLKVVTVVAAGALTVAGGLTAEASPPATAQLEAVGYRGASGDLNLTVVGANIFLNSTALDFTTLGLQIGEWIYIGGDAAANSFATAADTGYARISAIAAHQLTFDFTSFAPVNDTGTGKLIDIYFGKVLVNANSSNPALVKRRTYQLERSLGNDGTGTQAEYLIGACPDKLTLNLKNNSKVTVDLSYVGIDVTTVTGATGLKSGTRVGLPGEAAYNTTHNVYLSRIAVVDPTTLDPASLYAYASDIKIEINNGVNPNKAIGVLAGFDLSIGDFAVGGTATAYFATVAAINAIKNNTNVNMQVIMAQLNSGMVFDIPSLNLGGGQNKVVKDKPIEVDLTTTAAKCPAGYTMLMVFWEYLPTIAMPV